MDNSLFVALSQMTALERQLDVTANNIANANSTGFKAGRVLFESYLERDGKSLSGEGTNYVIDRGSFMDDRSGVVMQTGNPLDMALSGQGWFAYELPDGQQSFGRDGNFVVDPQGQLVTTSGAQLLDAGGAPLALPPDQAGAVTISGDGVISSPEGAVLGQIGVFALPDTQTMSRQAGGMFVQEEGAALVPDDSGTTVIQGTLESSNVEAVSEIVRMIDIQQAYQHSVNLVTSEDDLKKEMLQRIGRNS